MPTTPAAYRHWQEAAANLLAPLESLLEPGRADLPLEGPPSDHDAQADRLESFVRPLLLAAHWLQSEPVPGETARRERLAAWFRAGLALGTDPAHPQYWGPDANYHQHHVEIGLLCLALQMAPDSLWEPLPESVKEQVGAWCATARGSGIVNNNHLFMGVHILEWLGRQGRARRGDREVIRQFLDRLEGMHRGGGWFEDGMNQAYDHYNAYAFHFYGLWWARLHGARDPARAQRWREWARTFLHDYEHAFAAHGEHPAFGRSIAYRFNVLNVFGLAVLEGCCDLPLGRVRRLCTRNLDFFLSRPIGQSQGALSLGWTDRFDALAEVYSCAGSPYWAAKGLSPLLLPPQHSFWSAPEGCLASEQAPFVRPVAPAGLIFRSCGGGDVEILNGGSQISNTNLRYGAWKWSKTSYRTRVGFTCAFPPATNWSVDSALTATWDDGRVFGRHSTVAFEFGPEHLATSYSLGFKTGQANAGVESHLWWKAGWLLQVHRVEPRQPIVLRVGGFALAARSPADLRRREGATWREVDNGEIGAVLQILLGFSGWEWDERRDDATPRRHIVAPYHLTAVARTERTERPVVLAALVWSGPERTEGQTWRLDEAAAGRWSLEHPTLGRWVITDPALPESVA